MKNLYTIAIAAACTFSAAAATPQHQINVGNFTPKTVQPVKAKADGRIQRVTSFQKVAELDGTPLRPMASNTIEGSYIMTIGDYYFEESVGEVDVQVTIEADEKEANTYWIAETAEEWFPSDVPFTLNSLTNVMTFNMISFGKIDDAYVIFAPFIWDDNEGIMFQSSIQTKFNPSTGSFSFAPDYGFSWPAFADQNLSQLAYWYNIFDVLQGTAGILPEPEDEVEEGQWENVGMAEFADGWVAAGFTLGGNPIDIQANKYNVELQRNIQNKTVYRLWQPYHNAGHPLNQYNQSKFNGQIVFDVKDTDHIVVLAGKASGFKYQNEYYLSNLLGWIANFILDEGMDYNDYRDALYAIYEESSNGKPFDKLDTTTGVITINEPVFDYSAACTNGYTYKESKAATIKLPANVLADIAGVESTILDQDANQPVEYFNLQGVRIDNPTAGQLVIRKQGSTVAKQVVR